MGCKACELACAVAHSESRDIEKIMKSGEVAFYRIHVETAGGKSIPIHCNQCEDAACVAACPTGALHRKPGQVPVFTNDERCIGCHMCVAACPFGVITVNRQGKGVLRCDLCAERLGEGKGPACAVACTTHALQFVLDEDDNRSKRRKAARKLVAVAD
jgi:carbon-monoxide dehydrogenase iron sulfur subunit